MSFGGSAPPPAPTPAPLPPAPARSDAQTQSLADAQRKKFNGPAGSASQTYLTGGGASAGSSAVRYLGGSAKT